MISPSQDLSSNMLGSLSHGDDGLVGRLLAGHPRGALADRRRPSRPSVTAWSAAGSSRPRQLGSALPGIARCLTGTTAISWGRQRVDVEETLIVRRGARSNVRATEDPYAGLLFRFPRSHAEHYALPISHNSIAIKD